MTSRKRLTDIAVRKLKPRSARYEVSDPGARGLYVVVQPSGKTSYAVRYRHSGLPRKLTLQAGVSLAAARKLCADALHEVAQGRDPSEAKKAQRAKTASAAANTLQAICEEYFKLEHGKLRTAAEREASLRRLVFPSLGSLQIDNVRRRDITRLLDKVQAGSGARAADLVLAYLRRIFRWYEARDDDFRSPIVSAMARYKVADHRRKRFLDDDELRRIWEASADGAPFSALVRFLLLTGARRSEAGGLRWEEIAGNAWLLPASRNKDTKRDLLRPLSKAALAVVNAQPRVDDCPLVFTRGQRSVAFGPCKKAFAEKCGVADWRLHDLRRTARTLMSQAGVSADIAERCLGHALPGIRDTYDKHDYRLEMAHAFEALAAQIERIVNPTDNVTPLRRREG